MSHPIVHPMGVEGPGLLPVGLQPGVRMNNVPGKPGTLLGLVFRFVVAAAGLMCLWSFSLATLDLYGLLVGCRLRHPWLDWFFTVGDAITGALLFTAASMSGGLSRFMCETSDCVRIMTSTVFAYLCIAALSLSFFLNFSSLAS